MEYIDICGTHGIQELPGYTWISMDNHGYPWISMDIMGILDIIGYPNASMDGPDDPNWLWLWLKPIRVPAYSQPRREGNFPKYAAYRKGSYLVSRIAFSHPVPAASLVPYS